MQSNKQERKKQAKCVSLLTVFMRHHVYRAWMCVGAGAGCEDDQFWFFSLKSSYFSCSYFHFPFHSIPIKGIVSWIKQWDNGKGREMELSHILLWSRQGSLPSEQVSPSPPGGPLCFPVPSEPAEWTCREHILNILYTEEQLNRNLDFS